MHNSLAIFIQPFQKKNTQKKAFDSCLHSLSKLSRLVVSFIAFEIFRSEKKLFFFIISVLYKIRYRRYCSVGFFSRKKTRFLVVYFEYRLMLLKVVLRFRLLYFLWMLYKYDCLSRSSTRHTQTSSPKKKHRVQFASHEKNKQTNKLLFMVI